MHSLNNSQTGSTHIAVIAVAVVAVALIGTFTLVKGHASTCTQNIYSKKSVPAAKTCIQYIQALVNYQNGTSWPSLAIDGQYGDRTYNAVKHTQSKLKLKSQDGIVGTETWRVICSPNVGPRIPDSFPLKQARLAGCKI